MNEENGGWKGLPKNCYRVTLFCIAEYRGVLIVIVKKRFGVVIIMV